MDVIHISFTQNESIQSGLSYNSTRDPLPNDTLLEIAVQFSSWSDQLILCVHTNLFVLFQVDTEWKTSFTAVHSLGHLSGQCQLSLFPPPPSTPTNVIVLEYSVKEHDPLSFVVGISLMWQQSDETSALPPHLLYEYVITTVPVDIHSTTSEGTPFSTTIMHVSLILCMCMYS